MRLPHTPGLVKRNLQYLQYRTGLMRSVHVFGPGEPERISLVVPCSLGDVAINSGVTRSLRANGVRAEICLITDQKYQPAVAFNPDYDSVALLNDWTDTPPWALTYRQQLAAARSLTPDMDALYLCQPGGWCDALWSRYQSLELQHRLCQTPVGLRRLPELTIPAGAVDEARKTWWQPGGRSIFIAPGAFTLKFGQFGDQFFTDLAASLVEVGWRVFWNGPELPASIDPAHARSETVIPVGDWPLSTVVAVVSLGDLAVSARSGLSDVITFSARELPQYVLYPKTRYPYSSRSVRECYSLAAMGGINVAERENSLDTVADLAVELQQVHRWIDTRLNCSH